MPEKKEKKIEQKTLSLTIDQILRINSALLSIGDVDMFSSTTAYILSRLAQWSDSIRKTVIGEKNKLITRYKDEMESEKTSQKRKVEINNIINARMNEVHRVSETITLPSLYLSDFSAKNDRTCVIRYKDGSMETREFKAGQQLVPHSFFIAFGGIIEDDLKVGDINLPEKSNLLELLETSPE